jgi:phosphohistidine swiveling domain-containing protein
MVGRDRAKFLLTRCLSWALERLVRWGEVFGLSRDDLAQLTVAELRATRALNTVDMCALRDRVARASELAVEERGLRLSHLLRDAGDLALVRDPLILPTFVTARTVVAPAIVLDGRSLGRQPLERRIVCVESADPGYDWIFTRGIAGFVTCFGGAGSHMAIRCCELDVPAALGVGAATFDRLVSAPTVELRCGERTVRGLWCSGSL